MGLSARTTSLKITSEGAEHLDYFFMEVLYEKLH